MENGGKGGILDNREGIGTSMIRVPANDVGIDDPRQRINRDQQQEEQFLSSSSRQHHDGLLQGIHGRQQEVHPVSAGTGRPCDDLLQGLHRQAQHEQTWSSGGRQQQGLPSMEVPTMFPGGRLQQGKPRSGMEHVRPNAQEGFHQPAPNEDCSKLMDCCYKGILDNREGIGTSHARVFANVVDIHDQFQGTSHDFNVEEQTRSSVGRHQQGNMQSSMLYSHLQQQQQSSLLQSNQFPLHVQQHKELLFQQQQLQQQQSQLLGQQPNAYGPQQNPGQQQMGFQEMQQQQQQRLLSSAANLSNMQQFQQPSMLSKQSNISTLSQQQ